MEFNAIIDSTSLLQYVTKCVAVAKLQHKTTYEYMYLYKGTHL